MAKSRKNMFKRKTRKTRKTHKTRKTRTNRHKHAKGGAAYTPVQKQQLTASGFTPEFIRIAEPLIGFDILWNDFQGSNQTAPQYMSRTYTDLNMDPNDGFTDSEDNDDDDQDGGKKKRKNKKCKTRRHNKKGGTLFGRGYGANCNEPNYNVYNTNMLKLFPYGAK